MMLSMGSTAETNLIHFWLFDGSLPNDTPLQEINAHYSIAGQGLLSFHSALTGYPFDPEHANWRKASLERRNAPTPLNYRPAGNNGMPFEDANMRAIQVKQPFTGSAGENTIYLHMPTNGFRNVNLRFAAIDEGAADHLIIDYNVEPSGNSWTTDGLSQSSFDLGIFYQLYQVDFSSVSPANNNPHFKVRIRFAGSDMGIDEGDRVTFNNITLDGEVISGNNLPPVITQSIPFQRMVEEGEPFSIDLDEVFSDPENDPLSFQTVSLNPALASANISGSMLTISPLRRGDSRITILAHDGHNEPVETFFRVLVYPKPLDLQSYFADPDTTFRFNFWDPNEPEYSYPEHIMFLQSDKSDPDLDDPLDYAYFIPHDDYHTNDQATIGFPYNNTGRTRINGLGDEGISFINTGRGRDVGGLLLALGVPEGKSPSWEVTWTGGTILANERVYAIRLMYRVGTDGPFMDLADNQEYITNIDGHKQTFVSYPFIDDFLYPYIQLLWKYYHVEGNSGPRAQLSLSDIQIKLLVGQEEFHESKPLVYISNEFLHIRLGGEHSTQVDIYNLAGQLVFSDHFNFTNHISFNPSLHQGLYLVKITTQNNVSTSKIHFR